MYYFALISVTPFSEQVSFTRGNYSVREDEGVLTVCVERSGDSDSHVVVLIATHPSEGTATGKYITHHMSTKKSLRAIFLLSAVSCKLDISCQLTSFRILGLLLDIMQVYILFWFNCILCIISKLF